AGAVGAGAVGAGAVGAGDCAAAWIMSTATGAMTKNVNTSERPVTTKPDGASGAPIAFRTSDNTTESFTKLVSVSTTSGTIAASATSARLPAPLTVCHPQAMPPADRPRARSQ